MPLPAAVSVRFTLHRVVYLSVLWICVIFTLRNCPHFSPLSVKIQPHLFSPPSCWFCFTAGFAPSEAAAGLEEPLEPLQNDPQLSSPLDLTFPIHGFKSDLMEELMAMDASLPHGFSTSFVSDMDTDTPDKAVMSFIGADMGGSLPFVTHPPKGNQLPNARIGASSIVKSSSASRLMAAATAQDLSMVRRFGDFVGRLMRQAVDTTLMICVQGDIHIQAPLQSVKESEFSPKFRPAATSPRLATLLHRNIQTNQCCLCRDNKLQNTWSNIKGWHGHAGLTHRPTCGHDRFISSTTFFSHVGRCRQTFVCSAWNTKKNQENL